MEEINALKQELSEVRAQLNTLTQICLRIERSTARVSKHAEFVEDVYTTVRAPVSSILSLFTNKDSKMLPEVKQICDTINQSDNPIGL